MAVVSGSGSWLQPRLLAAAVLGSSLLQHMRMRRGIMSRTSRRRAYVELVELGPGLCCAILGPVLLLRCCASSTKVRGPGRRGM